MEKRVVDRQASYTAIPIQPRQTDDAGKVLPPLKQSAAVSLTDAPFAEIEIDARPHGAVAGFEHQPPQTHPTPPPQPIKQQVIDSLREQISNITHPSLGDSTPGYPSSGYSSSGHPSSGYSSSGHPSSGYSSSEHPSSGYSSTRHSSSGYLFYDRNNPETFYRKAKQLENKDGDYEGDAPFFMYYPSYQYMGSEQLKTYLTWRTRARAGDIRQTSLSYVYLYLYELLACVGVAGPAEGLNQLMFVWTHYRAYDLSLNRNLPRWLKDFHVYYQLPHSFADFVKAHGLHGYYPASFLFSDEVESRFELWNKLSSYDVTKSRFFSDDDNQELYRDCLMAVLAGISNLCIRHGKSIESLFSFSTNSWFNWFPFSGALFYDWLPQLDRTVELPGGEAYRCTNRQWKSNTYVHMTNRKDIIGYILKKTEVCLRQHTRYRYQISAKRGYFVYDLMRAEIPIEELDQVIEQSVADYFRDRNRIVVTVDPGSLVRIRDDALGIQKRLTVPEDGMPSLLTPAATIPTPPSPTISATDNDQEDWAVLRDALNQTERDALSLILRNSPLSAIKALADASGMMLEVLIDDINEKALDFVGDTILMTDDSIEVYPEYATKVAELMIG